MGRVLVLYRGMVGAFFAGGCSAILGADFAASSPVEGVSDRGVVDAATTDAGGTTADAMPRASIRGVVTSRYNTFALFEDGALWAWGGNLSGSLGVGDDKVRTRAVRSSVFDGLGKIVDVAPGEAHTCVLMDSNAFYCVGRGVRGALGDGNATDSLVPRKVPLKGAIAGLASASGTTCVRLCTAAPLCSAACWGENDEGQVGTSDVLFEPLPRAVYGSGISDPPLINAVAAGVEQVCAVNGYGRAYCWGRNTGVPAPTGDAHALPAQVAGVEDVVSLALGAGFGCAIKTDTSVICWGRNMRGQLGRNGFTAPLAPGQVTGMTDVVQLASGATSTCALNADGAVWCWGGNAYGQLGIGGTADSNTRQRVVGMPAIVGVTAAAAHACSWSADGAIYCWGTNASGELGTGTLQPQERPARVQQSW